MEHSLEQLKKTLEDRGYTVRVFATKEEAADYLDAEIHHMTVGYGGSVTLQQLGILERLEQHNQVVHHRSVPEGETPQQLRSRAMQTQVYLSSVNALAETGELVNIDGTGNRVAATLYGHEKVYFVVGSNKIAPDLEKAIWRARNVAAPKNAQRLHRETPCALRADHCYDCRSPQRICKGLVVLYEKIGSCQMEVVLVEQELGY